MKKILLCSVISVIALMANAQQTNRVNNNFLVSKKLYPFNQAMKLCSDGEGNIPASTAKKYAHLDVAIDVNGAPLSDSILADLNEAFDESELPYKIDMIDWNSITDSFRKHIEHQRVLMCHI